MASSARGLRVLKALEIYTKERSKCLDSVLVFNKVKLESVSDGNMLGTFTVDTGMCNGGGALHGGYISTVIDALCCYAQLSINDAKVGWTTNLNVNFISSAKPGDKIIVETKTLKAGNTPIMEACLRKESGVLIAKGTASYSTGNEYLQKLVLNVLKFDTNVN